jgi:hypothetical protein
VAQAVNSPTYESDDSSKKEEKDSYKEFTAEQDLSEEEKNKIVTKLDKMFRYALDHTAWRNGRDKMIKAFKYREGEQWTADELAVLEEREQPDTVNNQIAVVVNRLIGDLINQRFRVGYRGRNGTQDDDVANLLSDILLYVRQTNELEFEERDMADDGFTGGMGVLDVYPTFDDLSQPEIKVRHEDPLIVFPDPDARRYDWNEDARYVCRAKWWSLEEACETYPQADAELRRLAGSTSSFGEDTGNSQLASVDAFKGEIYIDKNNERVRIIEVQYKKLSRESLLIIGTGESTTFKEKKEVADLLKRLDEEKVDYRIIPRVSHVICVGVYAAGVLLEHTETDHKFFSLVPYFAYRRKTGEPYSLITLALSMQDAINKRESKALHLLNTNQTTFETSAIPDPNKYAEEKAKPDGMKEVANGALANQRVLETNNVELAQSQFAMHQRAQADLFAIVGLDPRMGQQTGELRSGAGLQRKYAEASKPVATLFDNIRRSRKIFAKVVLERVQKYFTGEKTLMITDDPSKSRLVGISADQMSRIKTGLYDVVATEFEDDPTTQDEQFRVFAETLPQILQFPPAYTEMLVNMSRIRGKDQVLEILKSQKGPPPVQPKLNLQANLDGMEPVERAAVWELVGKPEVAQAVLQIQPPTVQQLKTNADLTKEQIKNNKPEDKEKIALEMEQSRAEHGMKLTEMAAKHQVDMSKHEMAMQKEMMKLANPKEKKGSE